MSWLLGGMFGTKEALRKHRKSDDMVEDEAVWHGARSSRQRALLSTDKKC